MQAFLNDAKVQSKFLLRVQEHAVADEIVQGKYWEGGKGCAVGCTIHGSDHSKYETQLGIPRELAYLQDAIFEALPAAEAKKFPAQFLEAIPLGADLSRVWDKFHVWLLLDEKDGLVAIPDMREDCKGWIRDIAVLYTCSASGTKPTRQQEEVAEKSAWDAWDARDVRDARDAWDVWAVWAAWGARGARDAWGASDARIKRQLDHLLNLLREPQ